jgi:VIT1/CCC1 family predicted Fe2+/Mn2+ transporter
VSDPTITLCPTLANPEAFDNVDALCQELHRANENVLQLTDQLHETRYVLQGVGESLSRVVWAHMQGKHDDVRGLLDNLVARHVKVVQKPQGGLH